MPELPEVETTRLGIAPHLVNHRVVGVEIRNPALRWPVPELLPEKIDGSLIRSVERRGKYLLIAVGTGHLLLHLGMSGRLRIVAAATLVAKHDHLDILLDNRKILRFTDPRRFGCVLWLEGDPFQHPLLKGLGPEPLSEQFNADYLFALSRNRRLPIKQFLMDSKVVVGVGNIYANEALFHAGIRPLAQAGRISIIRYQRLVEAVKTVLATAIEQGGTTLRDFVNGEGKPGYFQQQLSVYGREGLPCRQCGSTLRQIRLGQRTTVYCPRCQR